MRYTGINLSTTQRAKRWTVSLTVDSDKRTYSSERSVALPYASTLNAAVTFANVDARGCPVALIRC